MKNITYLLGAGASADKVPILKDFTNELTHLKNILFELNTITFQYYQQRKTNDKVPNEILSNEKLEDSTNLVKDLEFIISELSKHQTVDTLAKKYFLADKLPELTKLKIVITVFLLYKQFSFPKGDPEIPINKQNFTPDQRYDSFIASIIGTKKNDYELPGNIKILSWNYDMQFELAFREYNQKKISEIQNVNQIIPSTSWYNHEKSSYYFNKFSLIHLNGVIGIKSLSKDNPQYGQDTFVDELIADSSVSKIVGIYGELWDDQNRRNSEKAISFFNYNWEFQDGNKENLYKGYDRPHEYAKEIISKTDILVVIGYSFPIFNRRFDSMLLKLLPETCNNIYVQDFDPLVIVERIGSILPQRAISNDARLIKHTTRIINNPNLINVNPVFDSGQFYLPSELSID